MMRYYKRHWEENRGDEYADWGPATYYFEVDDSSHLARQIEVYENGKRLTYSTEKLDDEFGMLADQFDANDFAPFEIQKEEFDKAWTE